MTIALQEQRDRPQPTSTERAPTRRRAQTRAAVLKAARECIREEGIDGATVARITKRCGVSWGVIQYHFGDRAGLFLALLEDGFSLLDGALALLEKGSGTRADGADRVGALIDGFWSLVAHDDYRVLLEVQLQLSRDPDLAARLRPKGGEMRGRLRDVWRHALPECPAHLVDRAERLVTTNLRGLALERATDGRRRGHAADRDALKDAAIAILHIEGP